MKESTAAFIGITIIAFFILICLIAANSALNVERWEDRNCPRILAQEVSDAHWRDVRRCRGYGR